jgi:dsDNA-binding SOS-regulon protein
MAVIVKYIVVRNGEEKMTFATKKEADAHDKMLDIADNLFNFLESVKVKLDETQLEEVSLLIAQNRDELMPILRGINPNKKPSSKPVAKPVAKPADKPTDKPADKPADKPTDKPTDKLASKEGGTKKKEKAKAKK